MAAPIITGTSPAGPLTFAPGETQSVRVNATDPDAGPPASLEFAVTDSQGNATQLAITVQVADPLTYAASAPSGWSAVQDSADPALFHITAPAA